MAAPVVRNDLDVLESLVRQQHSEIQDLFCQLEIATKSIARVLDRLAADQRDADDREPPWLLSL